MIKEYDKLDSVAMADLVRRGELKAEELLDEAMARTEARDPVLNSVTTRFYDHARAEIAKGLPAGPLTGVPYLLKDLGVYYAGFPTTSASRLFVDFRSPVDSTLADRYVKAGLVIFGKTNLSDSASAPPANRRCWASAAIRGAWSTPRAAPAAVPCRRWLAELSPARMPPTAAARSACPPPTPRCSGSSPPAPAFHLAHTSARAGPA